MQLHTQPVMISWVASACRLESSSARYGAGAIGTAWGLSSAYVDGKNLLKSESALERTKYGLGLGADVGITAGGIGTLAKIGPRWLTLGIMLGAMVSRMAVDLIPNECRTNIARN